MLFHTRSLIILCCRRAPLTEALMGGAPKVGVVSILNASLMPEDMSANRASQVGSLHDYLFILIS